MKQVKYIDADLYDFHKHFHHNYVDIHVTTEFIDNRHYNLVVTRLDQPFSGWAETLKVLVHYRSQEITQIYDIEPSVEIDQKKLWIETDFDILESSYDTEIYPGYYLADKESIPVDKMSIEEFETTFQTKLYSTLSRSIYAVGFMNNHIYMYNAAFATYYEIIHTIKLMARVFFANYPPEMKYHFLICAADGYFEGNYISLKRTIPRIWTEEDNVNGKRPELESLEEYPVLYQNKWMFGQSNHERMPFTVDIIDRHYLFCNLYSGFRSFHRGIPFKTKIPKIVFACRVSRSSKWNFIKKPAHDSAENTLTQRQYFYSNAVCKDNIECGLDRWIDNHEMVNYKYILDVDGNACTWDATAWKMNSGSVILKVKSPWRQWYYDDYLPWIHYVPIADDYSDLQEKFKWCEEHPKECEKMIIRCKYLFQKTFRFSNVMEYVKSVFERTKENLS
jgi:hypothetical protein